MLDPLLITTIVVICTVLILLFSNLQSKKSGFDEVWNEETKKLLNDQKEKSKASSPPIVAKKKETKKTESKAVKQKPKEINVGMLQDRLAALPDLEPEYVAFLQGHLLKFEQQVKDLSDTVAQVTSEKAAANKLVENLKSGRATSESKIAELKNANTELGAKVNKLNSAQNDLATKLKRTEADKQTALDTVRTVKEENRDLARQITVFNKEMTAVKEKGEQQKRDLVEKIHKLEDNAHIHHVDITVLKEKNEELHKQTLYLEKVAVEKEEQLKSQQAVLEKEKDNAIQQCEDERKMRKEEEDKLAIEMDETRQLLAKITDELAVFEKNNRILTEHNEKAVEENRKLFEQNEELVAANLELAVRCDTLEKELSKKADELAQQLEREIEKERELAEHNANQEKLIKQLQSIPITRTEIDVEVLRLENARLTEMLAEMDPLFTSPTRIRAPPPSPESNHPPMAGDNQQALLKLQQELLCLEKKHRERQRDDMASAYKSLENAQRDHLEHSLSRAQAELETIDQVKATVEQAMETLLADGLAQ